MFGLSAAAGSEAQRMMMLQRWLMLIIVIFFGSSSSSSSSSFVDASITIVDSGRTYSSTMDKVHGIKLVDGVKYPAHLQQIPGNEHLCYDNSKFQNWNVTVPSDDSPVALLVKKGGCEIYDKARYATKYVEPKGIVKFIIVDGYEHIAEYEDDDDEYGDDIDMSIAPSISSYLHDPIHLINSHRNGIDKKEIVVTTTSLEGWKRKSRNHHHGDKSNNMDDDPIDVTLMHVTYGTAYDLLEIIMKEMPQITKEGGTKIVLTSASYDPTESAAMYFWFMIAFFTSICFCCCLVNSIGDLLEASTAITTNNNQQQSSRPRRRRLTRDQVRENIPIGIYDGTRLIYAEQQQQQEQLVVTEDDNEDTKVSAEVMSPPRPPPPPPPQPQPEPQSLEGCTICLEEYVVGEKLRCLPCQHTFHARCIGKWLTERSSTCPLCKIDLYESEDEEEEEQEGEVETSTQQQQQINTSTIVDALAASWASVPPEAQTVTTTTTPAEQATATTESRTETNGDGNWWFQTGRNFGSWSRNLFSSRRRNRRQTGAGEAHHVGGAPVEESTVDILTTPLLQQEQPHQEERTDDVENQESLDGAQTSDPSTPSTETTSEQQLQPNANEEVV